MTKFLQDWEPVRDEEGYNLRIHNPEVLLAGDPFGPGPKVRLHLFAFGEVLANHELEPLHVLRLEDRTVVSGIRSSFGDGVDEILLSGVWAFPGIRFSSILAQTHVAGYQTKPHSDCTTIRDEDGTFYVPNSYFVHRTIDPSHFLYLSAIIESDHELAAIRRSEHGNQRVTFDMRSHMACISAAAVLQQAAYEAKAPVEVIDYDSALVAGDWLMDNLVEPQDRVFIRNEVEHLMKWCGRGV